MRKTLFWSGRMISTRLRPAVAGMLAVGLILVVAAVAGADTLTLTDGSKLEGQVRKIGSIYQVQTADGQIHLIPEARVQALNGTPLQGAAAEGQAPAAGNRPAAPAGGFSDAFRQVKERSDRATVPAEAVSLWERFLARANLSALERDAAEKELETWKQRYADNAELIRGRWTGGDELTKMKDEAESLITKALEQEQRGSYLEAARNYQMAINAYPNSFRAYFRLSYLRWTEAQAEGGNPARQAAERAARMALDLRPDNPAAMNNYGCILFVNRKFPQAIDITWRAARRAPTDVIVGNLLTMLDSMPPNVMRANRRIREINQQANHFRRGGAVRTGAGGGGQRGSLYYLPDWNHGLDQVEDGDDIDRGPPGLRGNGSGFFISPDGYMLTNKHVADGKPGFYYRVRLPDKDANGHWVEYVAEFIAADERFDVALMKVNLPEGESVPYLNITPRDSPPQASQVMVLGYPATGTGNYSMQITSGDVRSYNPDDKDFEVWFNLATTHGNSGGPIVDRHGHVVAILSAGRTVHNITYTLGVGARQIREFFGRIGDKAPDLEVPTADSDTAFNAERLVDKTRPATLLVLIFAGSLDDDDDDNGEALPDAVEGGADGIGPDSGEIGRGRDGLQRHRAPLRRAA